MRVPRKAAVLVLLALSLGTSGLFAAKAPSEGRPAKTTTWSAVHLFDTLWGRVAGVWIKEGCGIDPLGRCSTSTAPQTQNADAGCGADPWGRCSTSTAPQTQNADVGCGIDPWGRCSPGH